MPPGILKEPAIDHTSSPAPASTKSGSVRSTLEQHRAVWERKSSLRRVYESYFRYILEFCSSLRPITELGSGPGFFKTFCPEIIATDVAPTPWIDAVVDGCCLPYRDNSVGNIVMIDVFHHMARPMQFLKEAARVLKPGGRIVMIEPWSSPLGYCFYRYIHHEDADLGVDPLQPFASDKNAFDGNAALPMMFFDNRASQMRDLIAREGLRVAHRKCMPALSWLLTGGFRPYDLLPGPMARCADLMDWLLAPVSRWCALRAIIVVEQPADASKDARHACDSSRRTFDVN